jgi:DNA repair exonuclease SbcCD ATPase subunit
MNMKNLILKWCGLTPSLIGEVIRITVREEIEKRNLEEMAQQFEKIEDRVIRSINNGYDLDGMSSKLDDMDYLTQDLESRGNRWDEISDNLEGIDLEEVAYQHQIDGLKDNLDKVQQLDDRLTELLAGYKLDVRLVQEDF